MPKKASVRDVSRANRALLVRHLFFAEQSSRGSVGDATGLSPATVTNVVARLIDENVLLEQGSADSEGGRPRTLLGLNREAAYVFGADVGEAEVTVGLFDLKLGRLGEKTFPFAARHLTPEQAIDFIVRGVSELRAQHGHPETPVLGLGLGVPGIVQSIAKPDGTVETLVHAQVIGWDGVSFDSLESRVGVPVFIDNGAKTTTQAESWFGSARGLEDAVLVLIGDGAGAGIVSNGILSRGSSSSAGEWGHTKISLDGIRCRCGSRGCVETFVGASAVLEEWRGRVADNDERAGVDELLAAHGAGDAKAIQAIDDLVEHLGLALSNLVNLYNPRKIIIGGWFGDLIAAHFLADVTAAVKRFSLEQPGADVTLERSTIGKDAVALGAATLPLDQFIERGLVR